VALAPVVYLEDSHQVLFSLFASAFPLLKYLANKIDLYELFGDDWQQQSEALCDNFLLKSLCDVAAVQNVPLSPYVREY